MEKIRAAAFAAGLGHRWTSVFRSLLLLSGIWGILLIIDAIQGVFFSVWVFGAAALICIGLFVLWSLGKKWLSLGLGILLFSYVMTAFACRERIFSQGEAVYRALVIASQEEVDVTSAVLFITVLLYLSITGQCGSR